MITLNGVHVFPTDRNVPALEDIAVGLGRMPRFGGQTIIWWPVLLHSLACQRIAKQLGRDERGQLVCLMHDAHETMTADIPGFWKTDDMRRHQTELDRRIFGAMGVIPTDEEWRICHFVDKEEMRAEIIELVPQCIEHHNVTEDQAFRSIVRGLYRYAQPRMTSGSRAKAVRLFQNEVVRLLFKIHGCHVLWTHTSYAGPRWANRRSKSV